MAVVKANAYGHGLEEVARILEQADAFAVARFDEALRLRRAGVATPIVVLAGCANPAELTLAAEHELQIVVHCEEQIELLESASAGRLFGVWLKIDSGMGRLGIDPDSIDEAVNRLTDCPGVAPDLRLMTHLASADKLASAVTTEQIHRFGQSIGRWSGDISIANSAGILGWPAALASSPGLDYSGANWVRPGLMLYGVSPFAEKGSDELGLQAAMSFEAPLISVRRLKRGSRVGYGGVWQAERDSVVGVVAVGYADGYPWTAAPDAPVRVNGTVARVIGRVSMDMLSVDLTDVPEPRRGDRVVLWGNEPSVGGIADRAGTIAYELLTGVGERVVRRFE